MSSYDDEKALESWDARSMAGPPRPTEVALDCRICGNRITLVDPDCGRRGCVLEENLRRLEDASR